MSFAGTRRTWSESSGQSEGEELRSGITSEDCRVGTGKRLKRREQNFRGEGITAIDTVIITRRFMTYSGFGFELGVGRMKPN